MLFLYNYAKCNQNGGFLIVRHKQKLNNGHTTNI